MPFTPYNATGGTPAGNTGGGFTPYNPNAAVSPETKTKKSSLIGSVASGIGKTLENVGVGIGSGIGQAGLGLAEVATKGTGLLAGAVGAKGLARSIGNVATQEENIKQKVYVDPFKERLSTISGKVGKGIADVAQLETGTGFVNKGKALMGAVSEDVGALTSKIPALGKPLTYIADKVLKALPEALVGGTFGLVKSGGNTTEAKNDALTFGIFSGLGGIAGDAFRSWKGSIDDNISKALGVKKGKTLGQDVVGENRVGMQTLAGLHTADPIKVIENGVEKEWNPAKTTWGGMTQALKQGMQRVYDAYTSLAEKAGDAGAQFTHDNFKTLENSFKDITKNATADIKSSAERELRNIQKTYGTLDPKTGEYSYKGVSLKSMQDYLQSINRSVNGLSDAAKQTVSNNLSNTLRGILDEKIGSATGKGYQEIRNQYGNLKAIEKNVLEQSAKALNKSGGVVANVFGKIGTIDFLQGLFTGSPTEAIRGTLFGAVGEYLKFLKDPERNLQEAFSKIIGTDSSAQSSLSKRILGETKATAPSTIPPADVSREVVPQPSTPEPLQLSAPQAGSAKSGIDVPINMPAKTVTRSEAEEIAKAKAPGTTKKAIEARKKMVKQLLAAKPPDMSNQQIGF